MLEPNRAISKPTNWVEKTTLVLVIFTLFGNGWKYFAHDWRISNLERSQLETELKLTNEPIVEVQGQILNSNESVFADNQSYAVTPVVITVLNSGAIPVELDKVELRVFRGNVTEVVKLEEADQVKADSGHVVKASHEELDDSRNGIIDLNSSGWVESRDMRSSEKIVRCRIPPGQIRQHTFHMLTAC